MRQKTRKLSIRIKILLPASILILGVCMLLGISSYRSIDDGMVAMGVEEAEMAAKIAVSVIDGDLLSGLQPGCEESEAYQTILSAMRRVQEEYGIAYLYTLYTDGSKVYYGVDTDKTEAQAGYGDEFETSYQELAATFSGEMYAQDYIDYTNDGDLISVYLPIKNSSGEVVAILGSDYDAANVVEKLNSTTTQVIVMAIICIVVAVLLLSAIVSGIMKSLNLVDRKIYDLVNSEGDLTKKLEIRTGDEMELIAENVNRLLEHIREIMLNVAGNSGQLNLSTKDMVENLSSAEVDVSDVTATMQ